MGQEAFPILVALGPAIASAMLGLFVESRHSGVLRALVGSFMESRHRVQIIQSTLIAAAFFGPTISGWVSGLQNSETIILCNSPIDTVVDGQLRASQISMTWCSMAKGTRQLLPPSQSTEAVRWLMRAMVLLNHVQN